MCKVYSQVTRIVPCTSENLNHEYCYLNFQITIEKRVGELFAKQNIPVAHSMSVQFHLSFNVAKKVNILKQDQIKVLDLWSKFNIPSLFG